MNSWKMNLVTFAAGLMVAAVVGADLAEPVIAQVRAALVKDADHPARQAVTIRRHTTSSIFESVYTVPAGKKLIVEHLNCSSTESTFYAGIFETSLAIANAVYSVPPVGEAFGISIADGQTRLYFEPGAVLLLRISGTGGGESACTISGHTVDVA